MTAAPRQRVRNAAANAARRAGDNGGASFHIHASRPCLDSVGHSFPPMIPSARGKQQMAIQTDVIIVGGGLAGLAAAAEVADAGKRAIIVEQEGEQSLGGQAFWSLGGLFLVDSPEQRRLRIRDSHELALQDWLGTAGFVRPEDYWPRRWTEAYVAFAAGEKRAWLHAQGVRFFPIVGCAERGGYGAIGHGNSVPRFHLTWGTGPGVVKPFERRVREAASRGLIP